MAALDLSCLDMPARARAEHEQSLGPDLSGVANRSVAKFDLPEVSNIDAFQREAVDLVKPNHGTTTLAFKFAKGIVIAVDSRATGGQYIMSQTVNKALPINRYLIGTMAGGAADCQFWERNLGVQCRLYELNHKKRITTAAASKLLSNVFYQYRGQGLSAGIMIAGWDYNGPNLYYVSDDGQRLPGKRFSVGSGSIFAYGVLDAGYSWDMSKEDAIELGSRAIYHAGYRDAMSGGTCSVYLMDETGWTKVRGDGIGDTLHDRYYPVPGDDAMEA